jgi:hypothetical protein
LWECLCIKTNRKSKQSGTVGDSQASLVAIQ